MRASALLSFAVACTLAFTHSMARADQVAIDASKDNTLFQRADGTLSNGAGAWMFSGLTNQDSLRRAVIAFDIAAHVPTGATITAVTLQLNVSKVRSSQVTHSSALHRLTSDWGEGTSESVVRGGGLGAPATPNDATWLHGFYDQVLWQQEGGDFVAQASALTDITAEGFVVWNTTAALVADVQMWLDTPSNNFGWIILTDETMAASAARFDTREAASEANRPILLVDFDATAVESATWSALKALFQ